MDESQEQVKPPFRSSLFPVALSGSDRKASLFPIGQTSTTDVSSSDWLSLSSFDERLVVPNRPPEQNFETDEADEDNNINNSPSPHFSLSSVRSTESDDAAFQVLRAEKVLTLEREGERDTSGSSSDEGERTDDEERSREKDGEKKREKRKKSEKKRRKEEKKRRKTEGNRRDSEFLNLSYFDAEVTPSSVLPPPPSLSPLDLLSMSSFSKTTSEREYEFDTKGDRNNLAYESIYRTHLSRYFARPSLSLLLSSSKKSSSFLPLPEEERDFTPFAVWNGKGEREEETKGEGRRKQMRYFAGAVLSKETDKDFKRWRVGRKAENRRDGDCARGEREKSGREGGSEGGEEGSERDALFLPLSLEEGEKERERGARGEGGRGRGGERGGVREREREGQGGEEEENESREEYLRKRTREFNERTRENPKDEELWMKFIAFQDEFMSHLYISSHATSASNALSHLVYEKKKILCEKAMREIPGSLSLQLEYLKIRSFREDPTTIEFLWKRTLRAQPHNYALWKSFVSFKKSLNFSHFNVSELRQTYWDSLLALSTFAERCAKKLIQHRETVAGIVGESAEDGKKGESVERLLPIFEDASRHFPAVVLGGKDGRCVGFPCDAFSCPGGEKCSLFSALIEAETAVADIFFDACRFEWQSGHKELCLSLLQAILEFVDFCPDFGTEREAGEDARRNLSKSQSALQIRDLKCEGVSLSHSSKLLLFRTYFESGEAFVGEEKSKGWKVFWEREQEKLQGWLFAEEGEGESEGEAEGGGEDDNHIRDLEVFLSDESLKDKFESLILEGGRRVSEREREREERGKEGVRKEERENEGRECEKGEEEGGERSGMEGEKWADESSRLIQEDSMGEEGESEGEKRKVERAEETLEEVEGDDPLAYSEEGQREGRREREEGGAERNGGSSDEERGGESLGEEERDFSPADVEDELEVLQRDVGVWLEWGEEERRREKAGVWGEKWRRTEGHLMRRKTTKDSENEEDSSSSRCSVSFDELSPFLFSVRSEKVKLYLLFSALEFLGAALPAQWRSSMHRGSRERDEEREEISGEVLRALLSTAPSASLLSPSPSLPSSFSSCLAFSLTGSALPQALDFSCWGVSKCQKNIWRLLREMERRKVESGASEGVNKREGERRKSGYEGSEREVEDVWRVSWGEGDGQTVGQGGGERAGAEMIADLVGADWLELEIFESFDFEKVVASDGFVDESLEEDMGAFSRTFFMRNLVQSGMERFPECPILKESRISLEGQAIFVSKFYASMVNFLRSVWDGREKERERVREREKGEKWGRSGETALGYDRESVGKLVSDWFVHARSAATAGALSLAKGFLKTKRQDVALWNAYAQIESFWGSKPGPAEKVFETAIRASKGKKAVNPLNASLHLSLFNSVLSSLLSSKSSRQNSNFDDNSTDTIMKGFQILLNVFSGSFDLLAREKSVISGKLKMDIFAADFKSGVFRKILVEVDKLLNSPSALFDRAAGTVQTNNKTLSLTFDHWDAATWTCLLLLKWLYQGRVDCSRFVFVLVRRLLKAPESGSLSDASALELLERRTLAEKLLTSCVHVMSLPSMYSSAFFPTHSATSAAGSSSANADVAPTPNEGLPHVAFENFYGVLKPAEMRSFLVRSLLLCPFNFETLKYFVKYESKYAFMNRLRRVLDRLYERFPSPLLLLFSLTIEVSRKGSADRVRSLFEKALSQNRNMNQAQISPSRNSASPSLDKSLGSPFLPFVLPSMRAREKKERKQFQGGEEGEDERDGELWPLSFSPLLPLSLFPSSPLSLSPHLSFSSSPLIWRLYMKYEASVVGDMRAAKRVFFRAINACPWCKNIWLDGIELLGRRERKNRIADRKRDGERAELKRKEGEAGKPTDKEEDEFVDGVLSAKEIESLRESMREKGLRLRTDVFEVLLKRAEKEL